MVQQSRALLNQLSQLRSRIHASNPCVSWRLEMSANNHKTIDEHAFICCSALSAQCNTNQKKPPEFRNVTKIPLPRKNKMFHQTTEPFDVSVTPWYLPSPDVSGLPISRCTRIGKTCENERLMCRLLLGHRFSETFERGRKSTSVEDTDASVGPFVNYSENATCAI